ncbi:hypothetical protein [Streptomyces sp. NPDC006012]|uniref:hypothetical protein n=1 Tax=Streptomyces sp. NPDC006012 TaxID=3364739 RepID=UPI0036AB627B
MAGYLNGGQGDGRPKSTGFRERLRRIFSGGKENYVMAAVPGPEEVTQTVPNPKKATPAWLHPKEVQRAFQNPEKVTQTAPNPREATPAFQNPEEAIQAFLNPKKATPAFLHPKEVQRAFQNPEKVTQASLSSEEVTQTAPGPEEVKPTFLSPEEVQKMEELAEQQAGPSPRSSTGGQWWNEREAAAKAEVAAYAQSTLPVSYQLKTRSAHGASMSPDPGQENRTARVVSSPAAARPLHGGPQSAQSGKRAR